MKTAESPRLHIEAYAIVSTDGMLANAAGIMPETLKFAADRRFFEAGLGRVDVVVHGRHSREQQTRAAGRRRLILTRRIRTIAADAVDRDALLWNPGGISLEMALAEFGQPMHRVGVIGGAGAFELFLDRYDAFYLSRAPNVQLPGGRPVFHAVPQQTPEQVLAEHGLIPGPKQVLDAAKTLTMVSWHRS
jgi:hypothetical protein